MFINLMDLLVKEAYDVSDPFGKPAAPPGGMQQQPPMYARSRLHARRAGLPYRPGGDQGYGQWGGGQNQPQNPWGGGQNQPQNQPQGQWGGGRNQWGGGQSEGWGGGQQQPQNQWGGDPTKHLQSWNEQEKQKLSDAYTSGQIPYEEFQKHLGKIQQTTEQGTSRYQQAQEAIKPTPPNPAVNVISGLTGMVGRSMGNWGAEKEGQQKGDQMSRSFIDELVKEAYEMHTVSDPYGQPPAPPPGAMPPTAPSPAPPPGAKPPVPPVGAAPTPPPPAGTPPVKPPQQPHPWLSGKGNAGERLKGWGEQEQQRVFDAYTSGRMPREDLSQHLSQINQQRQQGMARFQEAQNAARFQEDPMSEGRRQFGDIGGMMDWTNKYSPKFSSAVDLVMTWLDQLNAS